MDAVSVDDTCDFAVVGSGGSRLLSGNSWYAEELEQWIARFHRRPSALLFNSGYDANLGLMSCLPQPGDTVVCDELVHNSVRVSQLACLQDLVEFAGACASTRLEHDCSSCNKGMHSRPFCASATTGVDLFRRFQKETNFSRACLPTPPHSRWARSSHFVSS